MSRPPNMPGGADQEAKGGKSALPPQCPRCELTKNQVSLSCKSKPRNFQTCINHSFQLLQFTRTIQNFQKAYRKKVEGLKSELKTTRSANSRLSKQVQQLRSLSRIHVPSLIIGCISGALTLRLLSHFLKRKQSTDKLEPATNKILDGKERAEEEEVQSTG
jgi:hypothetical protein